MGGLKKGKGGHKNKTGKGRDGTGKGKDFKRQQVSLPPFAYDVVSCSSDTLPGAIVMDVAI